MRTTRWSRAADLFAQAIELDPAQRGAFLDRECGGDDALRRAVDGLLAADADLAGDDAMPGADALNAAITRLDDGDRLEAGTRVGAFVIGRELGAGGMGVVYQATREIDGTVQTVALKIASRHLLGPDVRARLRAERGILASLEHPNIARLVDAGEFGDGQPYFAMEYVEGEPITRWCDAQRLGIDGRLRLLLAVCDGVQHLHRSLVLHRDLKAGNILVNRDGQPKLLDFGIAKPLQTLADATGDAQRFFSPATAAPEQVLGGATTVATDVYALGVLLYELVAGCMPFQFEGASPAAIVLAVKDTIPLRASDAHAELAQREPARAAEIARDRGASGSAALVRRLRGDLDAIAARALRKEPSLRYGSVEQFAADLRAVLQSQPIAIRYGETGYRLRKFAGRHRVALALAALAAGFAIAFVVGMLVQSNRLLQERNRAEARQVQAEKVSAFLVDLFRSADPAAEQGRNPSARELLERGAQRLDRELADDPLTRARLAATIADASISLNDYEAAERFARLSIALREQAGADPSERRDGYRQLATIAHATARYDDAKRYVEDVLARIPDAPSSLDERLQSQQLHATILQSAGDLDAALPLFRRVADERLRAHGADDPRTRRAQRLLARALLAHDDRDEAAAIFEAVTDVHGIAPGETDPSVASDLNALAVVRRDQGRLDEAEQLANRALAIYTAAFGETHSFTAAAINTLGSIAIMQRRYADAAALRERYLAIYSALLEPDHPRVAGAAYNYGTLLHLRLGDLDAAEPHLRRAVAIDEAKLSPDHVNLAVHRIGLAALLHDKGQHAEADALLDAAERVLAATRAADDSDLAIARGERACHALDSDPDAAARLDAALTIATARLSEDDAQRARLERCAEKRM